MDAESDYFVDYEIVKIGYKFKIDTKTTMDIRLLVMSDLLPDNFDIAVYHQINRLISVGAGTMLYKLHLNFERFYILNQNILIITSLMKMRNNGNNMTLAFILRLFLYP